MLANDLHGSAPSGSAGTCAPAGAGRARSASGRVKEIAEYLDLELLEAGGRDALLGALQQAGDRMALPAGSRGVVVEHLDPAPPGALVPAKQCRRVAGLGQ